MDIDNWIENYEFCCDGKTFVVEVDDLKELLQTHALVPREPDDETLIAMARASEESQQREPVGLMRKAYKAMLSDKE